MMIRSLSALLTLAVLLPVANAQTETITFLEKKAEVGDRRIDRGDMSMTLNIDISMGGQVLQSMEQVQTEDDEVHTTILAMEGEQITKLEINCVRKVSVQNTPMGEMEDESPLTGQTFIAIWKDGDIEVQALQVNPLGAELEEAALEEANGKFGGDDGRFQQILPEGPMEVGTTIEVDPAMASSIFGQNDDSPLTDVKMSLTLTGKKEHAGHKCGVFDVVLTLGGEVDAGITMGVELSGELLLGIETSKPHSMALEGDVKMEGAQDQGGQAIEFSGVGPMKISRTATYDSVN